MRPVGTAGRSSIGPRCRTRAGGDQSGGRYRVKKDTAGQIVREAAAEFERVPEVLRWVFARLYQAFGGLYRGEIGAWADAPGVSLGTATMLNCAYELSHLRLPKLFGCTAGVRWADGLGMVHLGEVEEECSHEDSGRRAEALGRALAEVGPACTLDETVGVLNRPPVLNRYTVQRMAFCPRTGDVRVWSGAGVEGA
jgi:hypothetical protein